MLLMAYILKKLKIFLVVNYCTLSKTTISFVNPHFWEKDRNRDEQIKKVRVVPVPPRVHFTYASGITVWCLS